MASFPSASSDPFPRITVLWGRRAALEADEWKELYQRVVGALRHYRPDILGSLADVEEDLPHQFFVERVMSGASSSGPAHLGALQVYYRRYLIDLNRAQKWDRRGQADTADDDDAPQDLACEPFDGVKAQDVLRDFGVSLDMAVASARSFLDSLSADMLTLLRYCGCAGIAASHYREQIASVQYRCGQLGLVHRRTGAAASTARDTLSPVNSDTLIARWLGRLLGREALFERPSEDALIAAQALIDLLCAVALEDAQEFPQQEASV